MKSSLAMFIAMTTTSCGAAVRRFPLRAPMVADNDMRPFTPAPPSFYSPYLWDGMDNSVFRPVAEFFLFEPGREAINVNSLDEVADSSWFTNRLSNGPMSVEAVARGSCVGSLDEIPQPWTVVGGKPDGSNPGFILRDGEGHKHLIKPDTELQRERPSAADPIASAMFYAAGYYVPCNRVVFLDRTHLVLAPDAEIRHTNGRREPMTEEHVERVLEAAVRREDGLYRFAASQFIDGRPIAPWRYEDTWDADPNDVVAHHDRRELRGMYVLAAWTNRIDSRQENTMAAWIAPSADGPGYVRHYVIDLSETFGILFTWDELAQRFGHSGYLDFEHIVGDFLTLGLVDRSWRNVQRGPSWPTFGYYDVERFVPDQWRPGYPNKSFTSHTERDAAWMARIIARFSDEHIRGLTARGRFASQATTDDLTRILIGRRDRILERYLTRLSPLVFKRMMPGANGQRACFEDLAVLSGIRPRETRVYHANTYVEAAPVVESTPTSESFAEVCVDLPTLRPGSMSIAYEIIDLVAETTGRERTAPLRVHMMVNGSSDHVLVGIERPANAEAPR